MSVIALIPARSGSKGIPGKNLRRLGGSSLIGLAVECAHKADCEVVLTTDIPAVRLVDGWQAPLPKPGEIARGFTYLERPSNLAQDDTPMIAVVQHALEQIPGPPDDIIVLLQPTQPFRTPNHVREAIRLLRSGDGPDSIASVVRIPDTHAPECVVRVGPWPSGISVQQCPTRRQDVAPAYIRDGTVYAFWRHTVTEYHSLYGSDCRPLIVDPSETCELDTEADWQAVQARWQARHGATA